MRRREFITLLGGTAAAWPLAARAQPSGAIRRVGVLMYASDSEPTGQQFVAAFREGLQKLGWTDGRNARIEVRWAAGDDERYRVYAGELVALAPDVVIGTNTTTVLAHPRIRFLQDL